MVTFWRLSPQKCENEFEIMQIWNLASRTHICQMWKVGICNFSLYLSLPSLADLPIAVVLLCPAQIIAISTFFLSMTKLALSPSPSLSSVFGLNLNSWYVPVVSFESHGGTLLLSLLFVKSRFLSACIFQYAIPCISLLELRPCSLWWKNIIAFTLALCPDSTSWMRNK